MAELADARDLKSRDESRAGSIPAVGTTLKQGRMVMRRFLSPDLDNKHTKGAARINVRAAPCCFLPAVCFFVSRKPQAQPFRPKTPYRFCRHMHPFPLLFAPAFPVQSSASSQSPSSSGDFSVQAGTFAAPGFSVSTPRVSLLTALEKRTSFATAAKQPAAAYSSA